MRGSQRQRKYAWYRPLGYSRRDPEHATAQPRHPEIASGSPLNSLPVLIGGDHVLVAVDKIYHVMLTYADLQVRRLRCSKPIKVCLCSSLQQRQRQTTTSPGSSLGTRRIIVPECEAKSHGYPSLQPIGATCQGRPLRRCPLRFRLEHGDAAAN